MHDDTGRVQHPRVERVTIAMTGREKKAVEFVAKARGVAPSALLREASLREVVKAYDDLLRMAQRETATAA